MARNSKDAVTMRDWKDITIGKAAEFTSKPRGLIYSDLVEIPFVPMDLVPVDNTYIQHHVLKPGKDIKSGNYFDKGDCLIAKITPCFENGKQGIVRDLPADFGVASTELIPFHGRKGLSNKFFLFYFFLEATTRRQIAQKMEGATGRQRIPISVLKEWPIFLPPLSEQKRIAAVLLRLQRAIETQEKIIQSVRDLKKSTMQHVFTHGLRGEKTKRTEIGEIPESWEVVPLGQIASIERGKFTHRPRNDPDYYGGDIPFIQTGDVAQSNGRIRKCSQTLNKRGLSVSKIFPSGTILITIAANIGDTGILEFDSAFPDSIIGITPSKDVGSQYLEFYLRTQKRQMHQLAPKGTQMNINIEFLKPWPVKLPPTKEQLKIAQVLGSVVQKEEVHESKKSALQDLFKTTLNKLMTGEIRVKDLDMDMSEVN